MEKKPKKKMSLTFKKDVIVDLAPDQLSYVAGGITVAICSSSITSVGCTADTSCSSYNTYQCTNTNEYTCTGCSSETNC